MGGGAGRQPQNNGNSYNMLYFILIFFVIYVLPSLLSSKEDAIYSTTKTGSYKVGMKTSIF